VTGGIAGVVASSMGSKIDPVSWLVYNDVKGGREKVDFSEWNRPQGEADDILTPSGAARCLLSSTSRCMQTPGSGRPAGRLVQGLEKTLAADPPIVGRRD
jgi:hypothetical protein